MDPALRETMLTKQVLDYFIKRNLSDIEQVARTIGRLWRNRQVKVIVVDDSRGFRGYLQGLLESYRYRILTAGNGHEALGLLAEHPDTSLVTVSYTHLDVYKRQPLYPFAMLPTHKRFTGSADFVLTSAPSYKSSRTTSDTANAVPPPGGNLL